MSLPPPPNSSRLERIRAGLPRVNAEISPDAKDIEEMVRLELDRAKLGNENERALIDLRKTYGTSMIYFLWVYFTATFGLIWASSTDILKLPEPVAVAMIGGTMVSVLGVVGTIVAGLFRVKNE